ncbi:hypothetical protein MLD38_004674 [Melastoma candidum]|uniref:Uncharacterized protein n=1 Tax=Melastoma candidum TaxID=119954 RepID=A0ACB9S6C4_9MYRT|nr:hypothetical protein MLD38_004674 [Melastoma candidum]
MPTFNAIALDSLLEPGASRSVDTSSGNTTMPVPPISKPPGKPVPNSRLERRSSASVFERKIHWPHLTPSLYATPEATPVPNSPSSYPSSPYVINHKRRGPGLSRIVSADDLSARKRAEEINGSEDVREGKEAVSSKDDISVTFTVSDEVKDEQVDDSSVGGEGSGARDSRDGVHEVGTSSSGNGVSQEVGIPAHVPVTPGKESDGDCFFDPQESSSYTSNTDEEDNGSAGRSAKFNRNRGEFFDAPEELSSESGIQSSLNDFEEELRGIRLSLLMEMERRKHAEETLSHVQSNWQRIGEQLSRAGITFPVNLDMEAEQLDAGPAEELCQQVNLVRFVSEAIGRGLAKAEAELVMEAHLEAKNFEMARLLDRLHYYEAVNHEMSNRNQEAVEAARRLRQQRKGRQKWIWGSIAVAASLGASALAWSYMQSERGSSSSASHDQASERTKGTH